MDKETEYFKKRLTDLAERSYQTGVYTYTDFLTPAEQSVYLECERELSFAHGKLFGGMEGSERQVLRFGDEESLGYDAGFPICCIEIAPVQARFADALTHRDYLGALMSLGMRREMLGDILICEQCAYLFCMDRIRDFVLENLSQIKHTNICCRLLEEVPEAAAPKKEPCRLVVSGLRLDAVTARLYHLSRSQSMALIQGKKVFVNGRETVHNSTVLKEGDVISVRGYGKFVYEGCTGETKKGRLNVTVSKYV